MCMHLNSCPLWWAGGAGAHVRGSCITGMKNVIRISGIGDPQGFLPDGAAPAPRPPH